MYIPNVVDSKPNEKRRIYISTPDLDFVRAFEDVANELKEYAQVVQQDDSVTLENINRYRQAAVANMVGVIMHLYNKFPIVISIENLASNTILKHQSKYEGNVERPLERALFRRLKELGLTPPVSELVALRAAVAIEKNNTNNSATSNKYSQLGILRFVDETATSKICPKCGKNAYTDANNKFYSEDKKNGIFHCRLCNWHNKDNPGELRGLHSNDAVASFNIAIRGTKFFSE